MVQRKKVKGHDIAVIFGDFAPMHLGHVFAVHSAKRQHDGAVVVVSGRTGDQGSLVDLPLQKRFRYIREIFADDPLVAVGMLDESKSLAATSNFADWLDELEQVVKAETVETEVALTLYVGDDNSKQEILQIHPNWQVEKIDQTTIPISSTKIREHPMENWNYITQPFHRHFTKKVLLAGAASTGKTTLGQDLARTFHAPLSLEYAREYQDKYNVTDDELTVKDYTYLLTEQYRQTADLIEGESNHGLVIADTNSTVTMAYIEYYLKNEIAKEDYAMLKNLYESIVTKEEWDLILFTLPGNEYVDDGFRDMSMNSAKIRDEFTQLVLNLLKEAGFADKIIILSNQTGNNMYYENYLQSIESFKEKLDIIVGQM